MAGVSVEGTPLKFFQVLAQRFRGQRIRKPFQALFVQMRRLLQADALCDRNQAVHANVRHRFMSGLHSVRVQFDPAGVGQFDEPARGRRESLQIGRGKFQAFLFPLGGN